MRLCTFSLLLASGGLCLLHTAHAQPYRCTVGDTLYITDRPCTPVNPAPARLGGAGPVNTPTAYRSPSVTQPLQQAPDHQRFLNQRCAELNDAVRTAPARGVGHAVVRDLQREYQSSCADDDSYARQRAADLRSQAREADRAQRRQAELSQQEQQRLQDRCMALRDAARARRAEGDKKLTLMAEEAYNAQCLGR
ncbi:hypothetical protein DBR42_26910 [Pelomonas sp. HMWF004]|nr:hypothetical protein DBR42_26910 [Pelomonas sp. HMWF004]